MTNTEKLHIKTRYGYDKSPSCGVRQIYDGSFSQKLIAGQGIFAKLLQDAGVKIIDAEDIANEMV